MAVPVLDLEPLRLTLEMSGKCRTIVRHVAGMDPIEPLLPRRKFLGRQRYEVIEARRVVHVAGRNVPLVDRLIACLYGGRVCLLAFRRILPHPPPFAHTADAATKPGRASRRITDRQTTVL